MFRKIILFVIIICMMISIIPFNSVLASTSTNPPSSNTGSGWTNPGNVYANDSSYASVTSGSPSGNNIYGGYNFTYLPTDSVTQVRVRADAWDAALAYSSYNPTANTNGTNPWTNPSNAYSSDGSYATAIMGYDTDNYNPSSNTGGSTAWTNPTNAYSQDDTYATAEAFCAYLTPTYRATGTVAATTTSTTVGLPAGMSSEDLVILIIATESDYGYEITDEGSIDWDDATGEAISGGDSVYMLWGFYTSGSTGPTIQVVSGGSYLIARTVAYYNCSGVHLDLAASGTEETSDTSFSFATGMSSVFNNQLILCCCSTTYDGDSTAQFTTMANTSLTSLAERMDNSTASGNGGGFALAEGLRATAGTCGTFTSTLSNASPKAYAMIPLLPKIDTSPTPTYRSVGAASSGTTSGVTPALPSGMSKNDICILTASTIAGGSISITANGSVGTWTGLTGSPIDVTSGEKLYVWWGRWSSGTTGPTVQATSDHIYTNVTAFYNCLQTASPIDTSNTGTETTSDTSFSFATGISTTYDDELVVCICSTGADGTTAQFTTMANTSLTSLAERVDGRTSNGGGGGYALAQGYKATAGTCGTFTSTLSTASTKSYIAFSFLKSTNVYDHTQTFGDFNISVTNPVVGVTLCWDMYATNAYQYIGIEVTVDGGSNWTILQSIGNGATADTDEYGQYILDGIEEDFSATELNNTNFKIKFIAEVIGGSPTFYLDHLYIEIREVIIYDHIYGTFGISGTDTITAVEIGYEAHCVYSLSLDFYTSSNGGSSWSSVHTSNTLATTDPGAYTYIDVTSDYTWTWTLLNNTNFKIKVLSNYDDISSPTVNIDALVIRITTSFTANDQIKVYSSSDGGSAWSSAHTQAVTGSETTYWIDITSDYTWTYSTLNNTNFRIKIEAYAVDAAGQLRVDYLPVEVTYTSTSTLYSPSANTGSGWTDPTNAYDNDTDYAYVTTGTPSSSNTWGTFGISTSDTITGVYVRYDAYSAGKAANATSQIISGTAAAISTSYTYRGQAFYGAYTNNNATLSTAYNGACEYLPTSGTIDQLYWRLSDSPGSGATLTITLYKNGSSTSLTSTISGTSETTGNDTTHSVTVATGDTVAYIITSTGTVSSGRIPAYSARFTPNIPNETLIMNRFTSSGSVSPQYQYLQGGSYGNSTEAAFIVPCPTAGTFKNMYAYTLTSFGSGSESYTYTLRKNSSDSNLAVTITAPSTSGGPDTDTVSVSAGNTIDLMVTYSGGVVGVATCVSMIFVPTTPGESIYTWGNTSYFPLSDGYMPIAGCGYNGLNYVNLSLPCTIRNFYAQLSAAPYTSSVNDKFTFFFRVNGSIVGDPSTIYFEIAGYSTTGNDTTNTWTESTAGATLQWGSNYDYTPSSTVYCGTGLVIYIAPYDPYQYNDQIKIDVSWDGGTSWSSTQDTTLTSTEDAYWYNITSATSWTGTKLNDTNFKVRALGYTSGIQEVIRLEYIGVIFTSSAGASVSSTPSSKSMGVVNQSSTYYAKGTAPSNPVTNGDCYFYLTNDGAIAINLTASMTDFTGTVSWALTSGSPGSNQVRVTIYYSGQNPASGLVMTNSAQSFYTNLASSATLYWDFKMETGTFLLTDGSLKTSVITYTATAY